jgi:uncharacterized protein (DUF2147 family)
MEALMKTVYLAAAAALLMATNAAQAGGISFEINGQRVRIDAPRNCSSLSCLTVTNNGSTINLKNIDLNGNNSNIEDNGASNAPPVYAPAPVAVPAPPAPPPAPVVSTAPPAPPAAHYAPPAPPAPTVASNAPTSMPTNANGEPALAPSSTPAYAAPAYPAPAPAATLAPPAPSVMPMQEQQAAVAQPTTPLGVWATEDNKGNVRIEQCGANLCGYAEKTNEQVLINMKPSQNKWVGRILDPNSGSNYDSTIAMKGPNLLKVQGCAFGGMFCGGQTWKRVG